MNYSINLTSKIRGAWLLFIAVMLTASSVFAQNAILENGKLRFGNGSENSVNSTGNVQQPFYFNTAANLWRKLTYSSYSLDNAYGVGGDKTNEWNTNGTIAQNPVMANQTINTSGFTFTNGNVGYGTIITTGTITVGTQQMEVTNTYQLPQGNAFIKVTAKLRNVSAAPMENVRYWIGTRDDWVGSTDQPNKKKGNLVNGAFSPVANSSQRAAAIQITSGSEGVLFYTTTTKGNTAVNSCCSWINVINQNPLTSTVDITNDGSYGFYVRLNDLAVNASDEFSWYYAAGEIGELESIIQDVASVSGAVQNITYTAATFSATTSVNSTGYWMVVPRNAANPTAAQIRAGLSYGSVQVVSSGSGAMTANTERTFNLTGLSANTQYDLHFVSQDGDNVYSSLLEVPFQTPQYPAAGALNFNGSDDYIYLNEGAASNALGNFGTGDFTVEGSIRTTSTLPSYLIGKRGGCGGSNFWNMAITNDGKIGLEAYDPSQGNYFHLSSSVSVNDGALHHFALTRKGKLYTIYIDGIERATSTQPVVANLTNADLLYFGYTQCTNGNGNRFFNGEFDEVRFWNRAICGGELNNNKNKELPYSSGNGLLAYYKFNQGFAGGNNSGVTSLADETGNGHHATLGNFALDGTASNWVAGLAAGTASAYSATTVSIGTVNPTTFCQGGSATLTSSGSPAGGSYQWFLNGSAISAANGPAYAATQSGSYSLVYTTAGSCSATSNSIVITAHAQPASPVISANGATTFCQGGSVVLTAPASANYLWSNGASTQSITVSNSGTFQVRVFSSAGCISASSPSVNVVVNANPQPVITASGATSFCQGGSVILTATPGQSYLWSNNATSQSITVNTGGSYSVAVTNAAGCTTTTAATQVTITGAAPMFTACAADQPATTGSTCNATVNYTATASGFPAPSYTYSFTGATTGSGTGTGSGASFSLGVTMVTVTASNSCGTATCSFTVTVSDVTPPVPVLDILPVLTSECSVVAVAPTANDVCSGVITATTTDPTSFNTQGTHYISWKYTDAAGNFRTQSQMVVIDDNTAPVIACPFNVTVDAAANTCGAVVNYSTPSATDNCGNGNLPTSLEGYTYKGTLNGHTYFISNTATNPEDAHAKAIALGGHLVTISNETENAFVSSMSPSFIWIGHTDRSVEGTFKWVTSEPVTFTKWNSGEPNNWGGEEDWAVINWGPNGTWNDWYYSENALFVVEFEGGNIPTTRTGGLGSGATFPVGVTTETWEAVDAGGNRVTCSFTVTVRDIQNPTIVNMPVSVNRTNDAGVCGAVVTWTEPTSADNCSGSTIARIAGPASGSVFPIGTTTVIYRATDASGRIAQSSFSVTVNDLENPSITGLPANITRNTDAGVCGAVVSWTAPVATDNCPGATIAKIAGPNSGSVFPLGTTTVTYRATDVRGRTFTASFTVTITDNQAPVLTIPANTTLECDAPRTPSVSTKVVTYENSYASQYYSPYTEQGLTTTVITDHFHAINYSGSTAYNLHTNYTARWSMAAGDNFTVKSFVIKQGSVTLTSSTGAMITFGTTGIHSLPNTAQWQNVSFINIKSNSELYFDDVTFSSGNSSTGGASATDICDPSPVITYTDDVSGLTGCSGTGQLVRTWKATDASGNFTTRNQIITIQDTKAPELTVPLGITRSNDARSCGALVGFTATSTDNCSAPVITYSHAPGSYFPVGSTLVTVTATDACGNQKVKSFMVTITDNEAPVVMTKAVTVNLDANGQGSITAADVNNGSADNCDIASMTVSQTNFDCSNHGNNTVTLTVTDIHGNTAYNTAVVNVVDAVDPVVVTRNITIQLDASGLASITPASINDGSTDNCGISTMTIDRSNFNCEQTGANTVTLTVTDIHGNVSSATAIVTVEDKVAPVVVTRNITIGLNAAGQASIVAGDIDNGSADACGIRSMQVSQEAFTCANVGANTVTLTVTDNHGNISSATAIVTVEDHIAPVISCPANATVNCEASTSVAALGAATATDACGIASITHADASTQAPGVNDAAHYNYTITRTWTATDVNGNVSVCSQTIQVQDITAPVVNCPVTQVPVYCYADNQLYTIPVLTASDNCAPVTIRYYIDGATVRGNATATNSGNNASGMFLPGTSTIHWIVSDVTGNTSTCTTTVVVNPKLDATLSNFTVLTQGAESNTLYLGYTPASTATITVTATGGTAPYTYSWSAYGNAASFATVAGDPSTIRVTAKGDGMVTYTVTVTDSRGCVRSFTKTITVRDIRCGNNMDKVIVCHVPPGNKTNPQTICIAPSAVAAHLAKGSYLGACSATTYTVSTETKKAVSTNSDVKASVMLFPNPSRGQFNIRLRNFAPGAARLQVMDGNGKLVATQQVSVSYVVEDVSFSLHGLAAGVYQVKITNGREVHYTRVVIAR